MMKMTTKAGVVLVAAAVVLAAWCPCVVGQVTQPAVLLRDFGNAMYIGHTRSLGSVAFNPSNPNELLSASEDGTLRLWDKGSGHTIRIFANSVGPVSQPLVPVYVAVFNPTDPNEILSGSEVDRYQSLQLRLWDKGTGTVTRNFTGHTSSVLSVAFNPLDPNEILSGSADTTLRLWDKRDGLKGGLTNW
eukprot:TRINITY_DN10266_c0_g2_i2.p1 TRINITY_DN10266_c0_g2~~TRINITY_DN10266_c0_g2_i2.p1  ORF type:complete len:189 (-),score=36.42 TRINITY_DN10266_c0_g2_i2:140-706(-)